MAKAVKDPIEDNEFQRMVTIVVVVLLTVGIMWTSMHVGTALSLVDQHVPTNPIEIVIGLVKGKLMWPPGATVMVVIQLIFVVALLWAWSRYKKGKEKGKLPIDSSAQHMGSGSAIAHLTEPEVREKALALGVPLQPGDAPGVPIGIAVAGGKMLYGSYEDLHIDIWGPRQGKSTSRVIPAILDAIGPVIATSNKRDVVDATRDVRATKGSVWIFDPQGVAGERPEWFWNPLAWVLAVNGEEEVRAPKLAGHFADSDDGSAAKRDPFFDPEGEDLLAGLFLAAAVEGYSITKVYDWVTNEQDHEPIDILRRHPHFGYIANGLRAQYNVDIKQRGSVFGTAKKMARCLKLRSIHSWVQKTGPDDWRKEFDEVAFVDSRDTLYSLSLEGRGSAAPLVTALTAAVIEAAMYRASRSRGGRLGVPLLAVLDEAANVVRWQDLPKHYSHFGSRGIVVMTVLQSWAQGVGCWGNEGMTALWAAANIKVMGSGVDDMVFLRDRSDAIGEHSVISGSASKSGGGKSVSRQKSSSRTIDAASLRSLPRGRAVMFAAGTKPVLLRTVPWIEGPHADKVLASIAAHDPTAPSTFEDLRDQGAITPKKLEIALEEYEEAHDAQPGPGVRLNK